MTFFFIAGIIANCMIATAASTRFNRSGTGWFFLGCLISPLLAGPLLLLMGPIKRKSRHSDWSKVEWNPQPKSTAPPLLIDVKPLSRDDYLKMAGIVIGGLAIVAMLSIPIMLGMYP